MAGNFFGHRHHSDEPAAAAKAKNRTGKSHRGWLHREDDAVSHGSSSLFFLAHDTPNAPSRTCIQGHDVDPGATTCHLGHPVG